MKYLMMESADQAALYADLGSMPDFLTSVFADLSSAEAARSVPEDALSPVEQCWHLADLECEGFSVRIRRLLEESEPFLLGFDGARYVRERQYKQKSLAEGISAFRQARLDNLALLKTISGERWMRKGQQEEVGVVALCDLPVMMAEHDAGHRKEIETWRQASSARTER